MNGLCSSLINNEDRVRIEYDFDEALVRLKANNDDAKWIVENRHHHLAKQPYVPGTSILRPDPFKSLENPHELILNINTALRLANHSFGWDCGRLGSDVVNNPGRWCILGVFHNSSEGALQFEVMHLRLNLEARRLEIAARDEYLEIFHHGEWKHLEGTGLDRPRLHSFGAHELYNGRFVVESTHCLIRFRERFEFSIELAVQQTLHTTISKVVSTDLRALALEQAHHSGELVLCPLKTKDVYGFLMVDPEEAGGSHAVIPAYWCGKDIIVHLKQFKTKTLEDVQLAAEILRQIGLWQNNIGRHDVLNSFCLYDTGPDRNPMQVEYYFTYSEVVGIFLSAPWRMIPRDTRHALIYESLLGVCIHHLNDLTYPWNDQELLNDILVECVGGDEGPAPKAGVRGFCGAGKEGTDLDNVKAEDIRKWATVIGLAIGKENDHKWANRGHLKENLEGHGNATPEDKSLTKFLLAILCNDQLNFTAYGLLQSRHWDSLRNSRWGGHGGVACRFENLWRDHEAAAFRIHGN